MLQRTLFGTGFIFLVVLVFMPRQDETDSLSVARDATPNAASAWTESTSEQAMKSDTGNGWGTTLQRRADGHFYAEAHVNDVSTRFMVDTGASTIALTGSDAEAIGLYWTEDDIEPVARGASGTVYGVRVKLEHVELGGFEARNLSAIVVPDGLDVSLLGQSFLGTIGNVQIRDDEMVLERG